MKNPLDNVSQVAPRHTKPEDKAQKAVTGMYQYFLKVRQHNMHGPLRAGCAGSLVGVALPVCNTQNGNSCTTHTAVVWLSDGFNGQLRTHSVRRVQLLPYCCRSRAWPRRWVAKGVALLTSKLRGSAWRQ